MPVIKDFMYNIVSSCKQKHTNVSSKESNHPRPELLRVLALVSKARILRRLPFSSSRTKNQRLHLKAPEIHSEMHCSLILILIRRDN